MQGTNVHGLQRKIPSPTKRIVRQECGFGCAVCGAAIVVYHHFDPKFESAREHRAEGIVLLCPNHHTTFGHLAVEDMRKFRKSPRCREDGFTYDKSLFAFEKAPKVKLGNITATSGQIIKHRNRVLFGLCRPEEEGGPLRLTCELYDDRGMPMLSIRDNEVNIGIAHFDVEWQKEGKELYIRRKLGDIILRMTTNRIDDICITHLSTSLAGGTISCTPHTGLRMQAPSGGNISVRGQISGEVGIWLTDDKICLLAANSSGGAGVAQNWSTG